MRFNCHLANQQSHYSLTSPLTVVSNYFPCVLLSLFFPSYWLLRSMVCVWQVLEQRSDGHWKGYVANEGRMARAGFFPSTHVVLVDSQGISRLSCFRLRQVATNFNAWPSAKSTNIERTLSRNKSVATDCGSFLVESLFPLIYVYCEFVTFKKWNEKNE